MVKPKWQSSYSTRTIADCAADSSVTSWNPAISYHDQIRTDVLDRFNLNFRSTAHRRDRCLQHRMVAAFNPDQFHDLRGSVVGLRYISCGPKADHLTLVSLGRRRLSNCAVTVSGCGLPRVWVRRDYRGYRRAYAAAMTAFGINPSWLNGYDIDHLAARSSVPNTRSALLEIVPVHSAVNQAWGHVEKAEKDATASRVARNSALTPGSPSSVYVPKEHQKDISYGRGAKVLGLAPPTEKIGTEAWSQALAESLRGAGAIGVSDAEVAHWAKRLQREV